MSRMRKAYPPEFKAEAVLLAREDGTGVASIADELPRLRRRRPSRTSLAVRRARFRSRRRSSCVRHGRPGSRSACAVADIDDRHEFYRRKHTTRSRFGPSPPSR